MNSLAIQKKTEGLMATNFSENNELNHSFKSNYYNKNTFLDYIWEQFLILFEKEKGKKVINNWLKSLEILNWNKQKKIISIYAPNAFIKDWIEKHFLNIIEKIFSRLLNETSINVQITINSKENTQSHQGKKLSDLFFVNKTEITTKNHLNRINNHFDQYINSVYNIENFLITKSNETVISAIQYFIEKNESWNSILYIYGDNFTGKTHLLQSIRLLFLQKNISTIYLNAETFLKEYIEAARKKNISEFESLLHSIDILIIDDVQLLKNKTYTQEFLTKIITDFAIKRKKIICSGIAIPKNINGLSESLSTKLAQGLVFSFESHSKNDIKNILLLKMQFNKYNIPDNLINHITDINNLNISKAESIMHKIIAESIIRKEPLTLDLLEKNLKELDDIEKQEKIKEKSIQKIIEKISNYTKIPIDQIKIGKTKNIIKIKYASIYVLRIVMKFSCSEIAKYFQYKDHTTISYACKKFITEYKNDEETSKILSLFI